MLKKAQQGGRVGVSSETTEDRGPVPQRCFLEPFMLNCPLRQVSSNESSLAGRRGGSTFKTKTQRDSHASDTRNSAQK